MESGDLTRFIGNLTFGKEQIIGWVLEVQIWLVMLSGELGFFPGVNEKLYSSFEAT